MLVGLSGGADSLALAAALAAEAASARLRAGAIVVDHALQHGSAEVAERAAAAARGLGLDPVLVRRVAVDGSSGGPEAAARSARYTAFAEAAADASAIAILTAHTRDDQAEQVLLALARGSGSRSIAGIPPLRELAPPAGRTPRDQGDPAALNSPMNGALMLRPFLGGDPEITRAVTEAACAELGLEPWRDPHNADPAYARVRVRDELLPALERALGPGVAAGLARSADLAREDADALEDWADEVIRSEVGGEAVSIAVETLAMLPAAVRQRVIHRIAGRGFGAALSRDHTLAIAALVTDWRGQGPTHVPGVVVTRSGGALVFERQPGSPRE